MKQSAQAWRLDAGKMPTGIAGLDEILHGGLPRKRNTLLRELEDNILVTPTRRIVGNLSEREKILQMLGL